MYNFLQLVINENMKIYRRPRTWIMLGILMVLTLGIATLIYSFAGAELPKMWMPFDVNATVAIMLITVFTVVIAAESVAGEFSSGTIKLLLIRPWSRSKILLSKYISLLLFGLLFFIVLFIWNYLISMLLFGYDSEPVMGTQYGVTSYFLLLHMYEFISLVVIVTLAFLISTVFRSGGLAIGLSLFMLLGGGMISGLLSFFDYEWVNYVLFQHLGLSQYIRGTQLGDGMTLGFSLSVLGVYYVVFLFITWYIFNKRDVAA